MGRPGSTDDGVQGGVCPQCDITRYWHPDTGRTAHAVAANPRYDLALWNLGVLHMREGVGGIVRGQAYLARAVARTSIYSSSRSR